MLPRKKIKGLVAPLLKYIYCELRSINLYLEGAAFSASTICYFSILKFEHNFKTLAVY